MKLGLPAGLSPLGKRLAGLTFVRLLALSLLLTIIEAYYFGAATVGGFSSMVGLTTVLVAFILAVLYSVALNTGRGLRIAAYAQLATDQLIWTAIAYISGGATSGSTSLYGLTCVSGAILLGSRGAAWAAFVGVIAYSALCIGLVSDTLPIPSDQSAGSYVVDGQFLVYPAFSTVLATVLVATLAAYLAERLRTSGGKLEKVTKRAEHAEQLAGMGRLAAGLAHEIRNPLGAIKGSIELLRTGESLAEEEQQLCEIIEREADRLNNLVTDMLDLSRPRKPTEQNIDLASIARSVVALTRHSGSDNDLSILYEGPEELVVRADPAQMRQVLWNLVRNAMQIGEPGTKITVQLNTNQYGAQLRVRDTGPGIPVNAQEHIFDAFYTTQTQGVGIGLAVVKQVADAHSFDLSLKSSEGVGTTFCMAIPKKNVVPQLAVSLLVLASVGCGGGQDWVRGEAHSTGVWWAEDVKAADVQTRPAPSAEAAKPDAPAPAGSVLTLTAAPSGKVFRNTYYDFPQEPATVELGATRGLFDATCKPIRTVSADFHDRLCVQGSGRLATGETVSFAKRNCPCAAICPRTAQKICFEMLSPQKFPHGRGAAGTAITPLRSVAVDSDVILLGEVLYIPAYHGLQQPDGKRHDGCFLAEDRGLKVRGKHIDVFTGSPTTTVSWNKAVPSNQGVRVIIGAKRCEYLKKIR